jgi:hypothetical protein
MLVLPQYFEICALKSINDYKLQERVVLLVLYRFVHAANT